MIFVSFEQNRFLLWDKEAFLYILRSCVTFLQQRRTLTVIEKEGMKYARI